MNLNIMKGWIYIISNKAMPGLIKVGYSLKDPIGRAAELGTGSPYPYTVEYEALVDHPKKIEKNTHNLLAFVRAGKEWFECDTSTALKAIKTVCSDSKIYFENKYNNYHDIKIEKNKITTLNSSSDDILEIKSIENSYEKLSIDEAIRLANQDDIEANYRLGNYYSNGLKVRKNLKEAFKYFLIAAKKGHILANLSVAKAYINGKGIDKDIEKSINFLLIAVNANNMEAQYFLAEIAHMEYLTKDQCNGLSHQEFAFSLIKKSADQGYIPAFCSLGTYYSLTYQFDKAFHNFQIAAEKNHAYAQRQLGNCYVDGIGCKRNLDLAKYWYILASENKDKIATKKLSNWQKIVETYYPD